MDKQPKLNEFVRNVFYFLLITSIVLPVVLVIIQYNALDYEINWYLESHWKSIKQNFDFTIELVKILGGLTAMFGLLYRSLQTQEQLNATQEQLNATQKSDNFKFYLEHRKFISEETDSVLAQKRFKDINVNINRTLFYNSLYPRNSSEECKDLSLPKPTEKHKSFFQSINQELKALVEMGRDIDKTVSEEATQEFLDEVSERILWWQYKFISDIGISVDRKIESDSVNELCLTLKHSLTFCSNIGIVDADTYVKITNSMGDLIIVCSILES